MSAVSVGLVGSMLALLAVGLARFVAAYEQRCQTEREARLCMARLASWNARADSWERWSIASGLPIPSSFFDELHEIELGHDRPRRVGLGDPKNGGVAT